MFIGVTDFNMLETTGIFRGWLNACGEAGVRGEGRGQKEGVTKEGVRPYI